VDAIQYRPTYHAPRAIESFAVVKYDGGKRRIVASGMTRDEARIILKRVHAKVLLEHRPNAEGLPYFKMRDYRIESENNSQGFIQIVT